MASMTFFDSTPLSLLFSARPAFRLESEGESGVHKGGFSKGGLSNRCVIIIVIIITIIYYYYYYYYYYC